ncbi:MAG: glycine/betaine ABC transporter substrate-binding protein [Cellulomonas sp. 73-92]|uniref:glycine betaine ABC transporter substrate-binding protein n=1 Tax=Cellulomonas sp. 73-92 TaxID=1895740 RepID=UPI00092A494B|nr:glycine betaine ABC transporter substrate-binding protein [Cellulomonas sp. 73-92]OJV81014.1 MAG: glycine/betaine ABC transporter substrate-binding protein [Cellulomonas sp. 73-92]
MRRQPVFVALAASVLVLAGCGTPGSSGGGGGAPTPGGGTTAGATTAAAAACAPVAGNQLVVLTDDKHLQTVDNVIPAVNAKAATSSPQLVAVLDTVSAVLDTPKLIALNKAVDVDRQTSSQAASAFVAAQNLGSPQKVGNGAKVLVGAANFSENATLAEIYADVLKAAGFDASTQTIGNRETYEPALERGDLTVVPEYAGTLTEFLNKKVNGSNAAAKASSDLTATVTALQGLGQQVGLTFGKPAAAQDQNAFAVTTAFAKAHNLTTLSDLAKTCSGIVLGGPPECPTRPFCQPGLAQTYGLDISSFVSLDAGGPLTKAALQQGKVALGLVFSSDSSLAS